MSSFLLFVTKCGHGTHNTGHNEMVLDAFLIFLLLIEVTCYSSRLVHRNPSRLPEETLPPNSKEQLQCSQKKGIAFYGEHWQENSRNDPFPRVVVVVFLPESSRPVDESW